MDGAFGSGGVQAGCRSGQEDSEAGFTTHAAVDNAHLCTLGIGLATLFLSLYIIYPMAK